MTPIPYTQLDSTMKRYESFYKPAKQTQASKFNLACADSKRLNDLDGRGALSNKELTKYVDYKLLHFKCELALVDEYLANYMKK